MLAWLRLQFVYGNGKCAGCSQILCLSQMSLARARGGVFFVLLSALVVANVA
jgi:hypothetical protein